MRKATTALTLLFVAAGPSFGNDFRNKYCVNRLLNHQGLWGVPRVSRLQFNKHPHEIEILFQRKNGAIITELVDRYRLDRFGQLVLRSDEQIFDASEPGRQKLSRFFEETVALTADQMARIATTDGYYRVTVKVTDDRQVLFVDVAPASEVTLRLRRQGLEQLGDGTESWDSE